MGTILKYRLTCFAAFAFTFAALPAARASMNETVKVRIHQSFRAGETWLPAGTYSIRPLSVTNQSVLVIEYDEGGAIMVPVIRCASADLRTPGNPRVTLAVESGRLNLRTIWGSGESGYEIVPAHSPARPIEE